MTTRLCDFINSYGLIALNFPTRKANCLDNVFTNIDLKYCNCKPLNTLLSDHDNAILLTLSVNLNLSSETIYVSHDKNV